MAGCAPRGRRSTLNKHAITVHIWANDPRYESVIHEGGKLATMDGFQTGHAALKLQRVGAKKGDYHYLSFWPRRDAQTRKVIGHFMPFRLGTSSAGAAKGEGAKTLSTTSMGQTDMFEMKGKKPTATYRFDEGLCELGVLKEMQRIADTGTEWSLRTVNCATAVAYCLNAGGAADGGCYAKYTQLGWTPNRLGEWCQQIFKQFGGELKGKDRKRTFYDPDDA
jgi:hypothetical protein